MNFHFLLLKVNNFFNKVIRKYIKFEMFICYIMNDIDKAVLISSITFLFMGLIVLYSDLPRQEAPFDPLNSKPITYENTILFYKCLHNEKVIAETFNFNEPNKFDIYRCWSKTG